MRVCRLRSDSDSVAVVKPASEVSRLYRAGLASGSDSEAVRVEVPIIVLVSAVGS